MKKLTYLLFLCHPRLSSVSNDAQVVCCPTCGHAGLPEPKKRGFPNWLGVGAGKMYLQLAIEATVTAMDRLTPMRRRSAGQLQAGWTGLLSG